MEPVNEDLLAGVDKSRRSALRTLLFGSAFAVPMIASFSMMGASEANAANISNQTTSNQAVPTLTETATLGLAVGLAGVGAAALMKGHKDS